MVQENLPIVNLKNFIPLKKTVKAMLVSDGAVVAITAVETYIIITNVLRNMAKYDDTGPYVDISGQKVHTSLTFLYYFMARCTVMPTQRIAHAIL